ncbi:Hypothetical predicted protein [Paramuricea clavata]|uniref:Uncharacterized protein n=1 Tax=Paramuricea clavata TaxID=317549 RepID=A0A6S7JUI8_PARCT|nr:Hypothetical predicted protein [Paramuricea clavata]
MSRYNEYRVTDGGLQVCNSSDPLIKQRWRDLIALEKEVLASKHCNVSVDAFHYPNYTLYRNFTVFFKPTEQSFTEQDYGGKGSKARSRWKAGAGWKENAKQIDGSKARKNTDLSKMVRKGTAMKTLRSETKQKSSVLPFSTSSPSEVKVPPKESTTICRSNETEWQNGGSENISSLENQIFHENDLKKTANISS